MPEYLYGNIEFHRADRSPCIICGHPTSDCTDSATHNKQESLDGKKHKIIGVGLFPSLDDLTKHLVEQDIWADVQVNSELTKKVLLYRKGQKITLQQAREAGLI